MAAAEQLHLPSGCHLCAVQMYCESVLADPPAGNPQETAPCYTGDGVGTLGPTWILTYYLRHGQLAFASQAPIDVTAGLATSPGPH